MKDLQRKLKIKFRNEKYLENALTHRSYLNENRNKKLQSNERVEFLGDAFEGAHQGQMADGFESRIH